MRLNNKWLNAGLILMITVLSSAALPAAGISDYGAVTNSADTINRPGKVIWMDLLTSDVKAAAGFYSDVFGWSFEFSSDGTYAYGALNGEPVASIVAYDDDQGESEGLWLPSISVQDVTAAVSATKAAGGVILEQPEDLPGRGRYVLIEDPSGAAVMLLKATGGDPTESEAENGWLWNELWTDDVDAATGFYESVAGYRTVAVKDDSGSVFHVMGRDKSPHASVVKTPLPDVEPNWLSYILVEDVDATARKVLASGGAVLLPPQKDGFNNDVAIVADPTGGVFALQQKGAE